MNRDYQVTDTFSAVIQPRVYKKLDKHIKSVNVNWEPGDDFKNLKRKTTFREDLTRRMQKEALKVDMERWNKEEE